MIGKTPWLEMKEVEAWLGPTQVFRNLTISLMQGEHTAILGPNGSGKSALLKLIYRSIYPVVRKNSEFSIFGDKKIKLSMLRKRIGVVSSELEVRTKDFIRAKDVVLSGIYGSIGINENRIPKPEHNNEVKRLMKELGLQEISTTPFGQLSDGEKRRLLIARAMIHEPDILILDEPTNTLDLKARHELLEEIRKLCNSGTTILLVTHRVEDIVDQIQRIIFLKKGQIILDGTPNQLLQSAPLANLYETPLEIISTNGYNQVMPAKLN